MVGTIGGGGGSRPDHNFRPKKYKFFFLLSFDSEHFKTCKYTKKIFIWVYPPPPPNQPNPCVLVAYLDTLIVFVIGARDGRSLGRYFRRIQKKVSWLHSASNLLLFQGFGQSEYSIAYILSPCNYFWIRLMWAFGVEVGTRNPEGGYPPSGGEVFHDVRDGSGRISPPIGQNRKESAADIRPPDCGFRR